MDNLPNWPGAGEVYSKAYRHLEKMAKSGHVTFSRGKCLVSGEMESLIEALNRGDEEAIKATLLFPNYHANV